MVAYEYEKTKRFCTCCGFASCSGLAVAGVAAWKVFGSEKKREVPLIPALTEQSSESTVSGVWMAASGRQAGTPSACDDPLRSRHHRHKFSHGSFIPWSI